MNEEKIQHMFLHVDLDAFFASVEQLDHPEYKGKPVIVGGRPEDRRGVVSTASYEARKFGVHSAMPVYQAYKLCPQGIYVHGNMRRYAEISYQVMNIFKDFSPDVQQMSIDEALIDLTGTERLFGPAEETAKKIKERVKKETGLTVSVGLASTQYVAKIASGYSKPDGFYYVKPGEETNFMLSLPLEKLWGAGKKTQELMRLKGINSMRDIYEKDLEILQFMFGNNLGNFLYNAVRGNEDMSFSHESKSHSISAETTFPYDIFDVYTAETALMELCYGVYFRLLRAESFSRTVTLKLRYEDFTTTNAQETFDRNVMTLDSFFEKIKTLFEKRYEKGRGIRLLGVGFDNVETEDRPYQQDLFESDNTKKSKIEKAILNLEKKHPEIKVQKARMLKNNLISLFAGLGILTTLIFASSTKLYAKENQTESKGAATVLPQTDNTATNDNIPKSLFNWDINDANNLEFLVSGSWSAQFENNLSLSIGNDSNMNFGIGVPIFKQEVDISFWAVLNKQWTFQADFADEFEKNTISLSYKGNGFLQSALISNRNITMADSYASTYFGYGITGGNSQAPGFSFHFTDYINNLWSGDFLLRYDMTESKNATFYGLNNVTDSYISLNNFERGRVFVFPEDSWDALSFITNVYVESKNGTISDANGKKYKKLTADQYIILPASGKILISANAGTGINSSITAASNIPTVLISFENSEYLKNIILSLGSYSNKESYLGNIQTLFENYNLDEYSYAFTNVIENNETLVVQNSTGFSPFLVCQTYDCGIIKDADIFVYSKSAEKQNPDFKTELTTDETVTSVSNFFYENHKYVKIFNSQSESSDLQNPINRYPFAYTNPEIYLNLEPKNDTTLLVRTYSKLSNINIGTSAIAGTIQVYKNGILDFNAKYDTSTGNIILSSQVDNTDKIYITWQEDSSNFENGAIVTGAGFNYVFNPKLNANLSITSRWPITPFKKYSTAQNIQKSFTAVSAGLNYEAKHFYASEKLALAMEDQNGTGILLASAQDSHLSKTYYLSSSSGYKTLATPVLNTESPLKLLPENNCTLVLRAAETEQANITGYKIPLDFDFSKIDATSPLWAAVDIKLDSGLLLKQSSQVEIALKNSADMTGYDFYIQLGINAATSFYGEESDQIPTWKINGNNTDGLFDFSSTDWQFVTLQLNDLIRSKLSSYHDARLIIIKNPDSITETSIGTVYFGPYEPYTQLLFTHADSNIVLTTRTTPKESPSSKELYISPNYSTVLNWNYISEPLSSDLSKICAVKYFEAADFSSYKTVNFDFAITSENEIEYLTLDTSEQLEFILDTNAENIESNGDIAIKVVLKNIKNLINSENIFHTLSIDTYTNKILIDNQSLPTTDYDLEINKSVVPNRQKIVLKTAFANKLISKGSLYIDNLYYKETTPTLSASNNVNISYVYKQPILQIKNYTLLKDAVVEIDSTQHASMPVSNYKNSLAEITSFAKAEITFADIKLSSDANIYTAEKPEDILKNAGHQIKSEIPLFKIFTINESYRFSNSEASLKKSDNFAVDFTDLKFPLKLDFKSDASENASYQNQNSAFTINFLPAINKVKFNFSSELAVNQKINQLDTKTYSNVNNYFGGYIDISKIEFSTGNENAQNRNIDFSTKIASSLPWNNISPSAEYSLNSKYASSSENTLIDTHKIKFSLPFSVTNNSFLFAYTRTGIGEKLISKGGNYISDGNSVISDFSNRTYFYSSIPIYELFADKVSKNLAPITLENTSNLLSSKYELIWKRKLFNSYKDLFLPTATNFAFSRDIKYTESLSDIYQIKLVLTNNAINCFGAKSQLKLFNWYSHEEIQSSLSGIVKIPFGKIEDTSFQTTVYNQVLFYITDKTTLQTAADFAIDTNLDWNSHLTLIWQRPGKTTFIIPLLMLIKPVQEANPNWKITRKNTLNIQIGRKELINNQLYETYHNVDVNFFEYYTITAGFGLTYNYIQNSADVFSLKLTIGGKVVW